MVSLSEECVLEMVYEIDPNLHDELMDDAYELNTLIARLEIILESHGYV